MKRHKVAVIGRHKSVVPINDRVRGGVFIDRSETFQELLLHFRVIGSIEKPKEFMARIK
jgi:hypothetical protein